MIGQPGTTLTAPLGGVPLPGEHQHTNYWEPQQSQRARPSAPLRSTPLHSTKLPRDLRPFTGRLNNRFWLKPLKSLGYFPPVSSEPTGWTTL